MRMGSSSIEDEWEFTTPSSGDRTIVLFGRTGNGKSATGNSILGRNAFDSMISLSGVTTSCKLERTVMEDGQIVSVIDTPGLCDSSVDHNDLSKEIVQCIKMARNGIDAVILVLSMGNRFTEDEQSAIRSLQALFGTKIMGYMIVVFTGGDRLGDHRTLDDHLGHGCPSPLKEILARCENRVVLFDNQTKDEVQRIQQVNQLMMLVDNVVMQNGGLPYTNYLFVEMQKHEAIMHEKQFKLDSLISMSAANLELIHLKEEMNKKSEEQLKQITETVDMKLSDATAELKKQLEAEQAELKKQLEAEQAARLKADEVSQQAYSKSKDEICKLQEDLKKAEEQARMKAREIEDLRKQLDEKSSPCSIL